MNLLNVLTLMQLKVNERKSPEAVKKIQSKKLKALLQHAYENVPFYREAFNSRNVTPADIRGVDDLALLPLTDKEQIQQLADEDRTAENVDLPACRSFMTSGTTGLPLRFFITRKDLTMKNLVCARSHTAAGMKPWDKISVLGGDRQVNEKRSWYEYLGVWRRRELSSWRKPAEWAEILSRWKPTILVGRVTTLRLLAEAVGKNPQWSIRPRKVFSSAGMLDPESRRFLGQTFQCPVVDFYTSFEGGCLAWECEICNAYHMNVDSVLVEVIKDGKPVSPGEEGEVVITNLHLTAMPFIRYRQGDMVVLSKRQPRCGVHLPLFDSINGRIDDYIVLKSGRKIPPQPVYHVLIPVSGVKRWRVIQESLDHLTVEIEPDGDFLPEQEKVLVAEMVKLTGGEIKPHVKVVDRITIDPAEKFRVITSLIGSRKLSPSQG